MKYEIGISGAVIVSAHNRYRPFIGSVGVSGDRIAAVMEGKLKKEKRKGGKERKGKEGEKRGERRGGEGKEEGKKERREEERGG